MAKILLVDDSGFQRKNLSKTLTSMGHEVTTAENGEAGLQAVEDEPPDLIITDLLMPVMDGMSYLRALKSRNIMIPTIVASADIQESTREECMKLGARDFLTKPVNSSDLKNVIGQLLNASTRETTGC